MSTLVMSPSSGAMCAVLHAMRLVAGADTSIVSLIAEASDEVPAIVPPPG